jgi:LPS export ABC transporter protein LptC
MTLISRPSGRKLKIFLLAVILIGVGIITAVYLINRTGSGGNDRPTVSLSGQASMAIGKIYQTATRDGIQEWNLEAQSAEFFKEKKEAHLKQLSVTFFMKDQRKVYLTADRGILNTDTNDIAVAGHVIVKDDALRLETEKLNYDHQRRIIAAPVPVKITGDGLNLAAQSMVLDLNTSRARLDGNVEGTYSEKIAL